MAGAPMPLPTQNTGGVPRALGDERAPKRFLGSHPAVLRAIPAAGVRKKRIDDKDMRNYQRDAVALQLGVRIAGTRPYT